MTKKNLDRQSFLNRTNHKMEKLDLGDGYVYVKELSAKGLLEYNNKIEELKKINPELNAENYLELMALLITKTVCDEFGNLLLSEEDVKDLMGNSLAELKVISEVALRLSGISEEQLQEVNKVAKDSLKKGQNSSITN